MDEDTDFALLHQWHRRVETRLCLHELPLSSPSTTLWSPKESLAPKEVNSPEIHLAHILIIMLLYVSFNFIPNSLRSQEISFLVGGCLPISEFIMKR